jgi:hypothetical protein
MNRSNAENVRIKRDYFAHLKGPGRQSEASIDAVAKALSRFESYTRNKDIRHSARSRQSGSRLSCPGRSTNGRANP